MRHRIDWRKNGQWLNEDEIRSVAETRRSESSQLGQYSLSSR
jgi:hypothetical protein